MFRTPQFTRAPCADRIVIGGDLLPVKVLNNIKSFQMKPREVKAYLDRYIIEQANSCSFLFVPLLLSMSVYVIEGANKRFKRLAYLTDPSAG